MARFPLEGPVDSDIDRRYEEWDYHELLAAYGAQRKRIEELEVELTDTRRDKDIVIAQREGVMESYECCVDRNHELERRLNLMRDFMRESDWITFASEHDAADWFDDAQKGEIQT